MVARFILALSHRDDHYQAFATGLPLWHAGNARAIETLSSDVFRKPRLPGPRQIHPAQLAPQESAHHMWNNLRHNGFGTMLTRCRKIFAMGDTITASGSDAPGDGDVHLEIDLTNNGAMTLEPNNADLAGYSIPLPNSKIVPDADGAAAPFMFYLLNAAQEVTAGSVGATTMRAEDPALDISFAGDADQAANVVFHYT